jgi:hypothetical protein
LTHCGIDELAFVFVHSPYADDTYVDWCLDERLDRFLRHRGLIGLVEDGDAYRLILNRVMAYIGELRRKS